VVGGPIWLFSSGAAEKAQRRAEETYAQLRRATGLVAVDRLTVEGRNHTSRDALRAALQIKKGDSLFASDPWSIKRRLEALPWVRTASVERRFPHSLVIKLTERNPVARFRDRSGVVLVDDTGAIIPVAPEKDQEGLIQLAGEGAPEGAAALLKLLDHEPALARRVVSATRHGQRRWDIVFEGGAILRLPDGYERAAIAKFGEFERQHALLSRGAVTYDMRLPDRLVIRNPRAATPAVTPAPPEKPAAAKKPKKAG
ncbi:MAG: cell division protein FtsQ/DivIB, partial [Alphaproteobacteria bacterium]